MTWTHVVKGIGCSLSVMLLLHCAEPNFGQEIEGPKIAEVVHKYTGNKYSLTCRVKPGPLREETLVYWLVNDTFLDMVYTGDRVRTKEKRFRDLVQNTLVFKNVLPEDFSTRLTCTALNPAGWDKNTTKLDRNLEHDASQQRQGDKKVHKTSSKGTGDHLNVHENALGILPR